MKYVHTQVYMHVHISRVIVYTVSYAVFAKAHLCNGLVKAFSMLLVAEVNVWKQRLELSWQPAQALQQKMFEVEVERQRGFGG
jgi:hypothetical protein